MTLHSFEDGDRFIANSTSLLNDAGISLTLGYDFDVYRDHLADARPDHILGMPFDPDLHQMTSANAFWIVGHNAKGDIMHTQAMRMLDLQGQSMADYMRHTFREFPPSGVDLDLARSRYRPGPGAMRMFGRACYHGEFWIGATPREFRGAGLSSVLGRYAFWQAIQHWDPDHVMAFMVKTVVFKGFAARHGYMHTEPGALRWFLRGNDTPVEGHMAYMDREDMRFILEMTLSDMNAMTWSGSQCWIACQNA